MSPTEIQVTIQKKLNVEVITPPTTLIEVETPPGVHIVAAGNIGPRGLPGPEGNWVAMTQTEYDALSPPDPDTLYVIIQ